MLKINNNLRQQVNIEANNYKAELLAKEDITRVLFLTKEQFKIQQDSLMAKLDSVVHINKIKDKTIRQLQYTKQKVLIKDSIIFKDTIIKEGINIDTVLTKPHYNLALNISFPNIIKIDSLQLLNEHYVILHSKKETIKPKKCWPLRWFQRKHVVIEVEVQDSNPYISSSTNKFIEIIK